ncbi:MAG: hypothetical protein B7Z73_00705 [Planctomycetia bacterium 21-64-5]|nr:MAG: hypothetical protein B7Z73_00705 [Planctomycetia bacterium 21-64-5]
MATNLSTTSDFDLPAEPPPLSDEALLLRYRDRRDQDAFGELVGRYQEELFHYLWRYLHDASLAEEVFQMACLRLAQHCDRFLPDHRVKPWFYTIATHLAIDALRHAGRHAATSLDAEHGDDATLSELLVGHGDDPTAHLEQQERQAWLRQAIAELPPHLRDGLNLVYFEGLKYADAARRLGIPLGTLKSRMHESLVKLNEAWQRDARA